MDILAQFSHVLLVTAWFLHHVSTACRMHATVFILQAVFLLSDTRGHKINVKKYLWVQAGHTDCGKGTVMLRKPAGASRSEQSMGNLDKYPRWSLVQIN